MATIPKRAEQRIVAAVQFTERKDLSRQGLRRRNVSVSGTKVVLVKIVSNASGGGKYNGRIWKKPTTTILATGNLSAADLGVDPGSDDALVLNADEEGQSTHDLTAGTPKVTKFIGIVRGRSGTKKVVVINGIDWEACT